MNHQAISIECRLKNAEIVSSLLIRTSSMQYVLAGDVWIFSLISLPDVAHNEDKMYIRLLKKISNSLIISSLIPVLFIADNGSLRYGRRKQIIFSMKSTLSLDIWCEQGFWNYSSKSLTIMLIPIVSPTDEDFKMMKRFEFQQSNTNVEGTVHFLHVMRLPELS